MFGLPPGDSEDPAPPACVLVPPRARPVSLRQCAYGHEAGVLPGRLPTCRRLPPTTVIFSRTHYSMDESYIDFIYSTKD